MDLYLIRHAPTHRKSMVGWSDVDADFSDTDRFDALHAFLPQPANLVSSDLRRTIGTADRLAKGRQRLEHCSKLREINFGDWELKTFVEIQKTHAEDIRAFYETPGTITPPHGECWNGFYARVHTGFDGLLRHTQGPLIAAVLGPLLVLGGGLWAIAGGGDQTPKSEQVLAIEQTLADQEPEVIALGNDG